MKRFFLVTSFILCVFVSIPSYAKDSVPLRAGVRDGYARLTFGWGGAVSYEIDKNEPGKFTITFDKEASLDPSKANLSKIKNVSGVKVLSTNPLKVSFTVPSGSEIRDFKIGKRIVIDIYDSSEPADVEPASEAQAEPEKVEKQEPVQQAEKQKPEMPAAPAPAVSEPETLSAKAENKALKKAINVQTHTVSIRSTKTMGVAAFESFGTLWIVTDGSDRYAVPALNTASRELFTPLEEVPYEEVKVYRVGLPEEKLYMKAKGGGLVWDLIMGESVGPAKQVDPVRETKASTKIIWPIGQATKVVEIVDPVTGQPIHVVLVEDDAQFGGIARSFVDFDLLESPIGLAIRPKVDDLKVTLTEAGVEVSRSAGLSLYSYKDIDQMRIFAEQKEKEAAKLAAIQKRDSVTAEDKKRFTYFNYEEWQQGSAAELDYNQNILLSGLSKKTQSRRVEDILTLGKMFLSHGGGAEALGYFDFALGEVPKLYENPEFRALSGVAKALDWKSDAALQDLLHPVLNDNVEVDYWKAYVLADLGDWQQAASLLPEQYKVIEDYPPHIANRLSLVLAEVALRDGRIKPAQNLLKIVEKNRDHLLEPMEAYLKYLNGEAFRQLNKKDETKKIWEELTQGKDDLFRTKADLALTIMLVNDGEITNDEAINRLERLRYAWRGDGLEANINYWLGASYFKEKNFIKGLSIMRDAASFAGNTALGRRITKHMGDTFTGLFLGEDLDKVSPVDAVALYEEFSELTPVGKEGDKLVQNLAERLVTADLLDRAANLLAHQVNHRLEGKDKLRTAIRLAAINLIDKQPQKAMNALGEAQETLKFLSDTEEKSESAHEIALLKIKAFLQNKEYDRALAAVKKLPPDKDLNRLRADVAWQAQYWDEAAEAFNDVIVDENISLTRPISDEQADLLLNRAIALNLSNDRIALSNLRTKYNDLMLQTNKARQFEVITRPRGDTALADRETLLSIVSEVDLFKDFLESYRQATN